LVVVHPVSGVGHFDEAAIADGLEARISFGNGEKASESPEEQDGTSDLAEDFDGIDDVVAVGRESAGVGVELPEQGTVGVEIGAVQREVTSDVVGKARIGFFHAGHGGVEAGVTFGAALFQVANIFDPTAGAFGCRAVHRMVGRKAQTFYGNGLVDTLRINAGVVEGDAAAQ